MSTLYDKTFWTKNTPVVELNHSTSQWQRGGKEDLWGPQWVLPYVCSGLICHHNRGPCCAMSCHNYVKMLQEKKTTDAGFKIKFCHLLRLRMQEGRRLSSHQVATWWLSYLFLNNQKYRLSYIHGCKLRLSPGINCLMASEEGARLKTQDGERRPHHIQLKKGEWTLRF